MEREEFYPVRIHISAFELPDCPQADQQFSMMSSSLRSPVYEEDSRFF
jgi:hypothetical protein